MIALFEGWGINGAWMGHFELAKFAKVRKQRQSIVLSNR
ncbi:Uncharacterised protein [Klebsiella pneumoniae]|nr:hypothetical protein P813_01182 [Klebsiella pneumoniae BIDMC 51]SWR01477.1 Uncharacterised protein [Klebsiella pneumoniae]SXB44040.1 Uncharacterised protein [Klebsiella pneumoniae]SXB76548.1 Uncharacterised protein [Klebsiella pneumoniae]SYE50372.1 Uncharacterised protein [Klebsiella pneumoniae]